MLHTLEMDTVTVRTEEEATELTCIMKSWSRMKRLKETAQQVKEICFDYVLLVVGTYGNANKITCQCGVCVTFN